MFFEFIKRNPDDLLKKVILRIVEGIKRLDEKYGTVKWLSPNKEPEVLKWLKGTSEEFRDSSLPVLRELLDEESSLVKIKVSECLAEFNDHPSRDKWEKILDDKFVLEKGYHFLSGNLLPPYVENTELPLVHLRVSVTDRKVDSSNLHDLGLTDRNIYIHPFMITVLTPKVYWKIPISGINGITKQEEPQGELKRLFNKAL